MERGFSIKVTIFIIFFLVIMGVVTLPKQTAFAAQLSAPVKVAAVVYSDESIYVINNGNSRIYYATEVEAAKDNWEPVEIDSERATMIDISWLSPSTENILMIKGHEDSTQTRVIIKERPRKLEVSINYLNINALDPDDSIAPLVNIMTTEGSGEFPVDFYDLEWKKGTGGQWRSTYSLTAKLLEKYLIKGTYLYFRIGAVDDVADISSDGLLIASNVDQEASLKYLMPRDYFYGDWIIEYPGDITFGPYYPDGTQGRRNSNEIKVKIAKKASPMVYGIDGEEFTADIKYGKEYKVTSFVDGLFVTTEWIPVIDRAVKTLPLSLLIKNVIDESTFVTTVFPDGTTEDKAFPAMFIQVRNYATSKTAASKITEIMLDSQRVLLGEIKEEEAPEGATYTDDNIYITYNGTKNMLITIPSATTTEPFEYCVVKPTDFFEMDRVVWTSVTKGTEVKILASKAVEGGTLFVRQKEIKSKEATRTTAAVDYALASTYQTHDINYPSIPVATKASYTFVKSYSGDITFDVILNVPGKKPFETQIKNIKLGTREILIDTPIVTYNATTEVYTMRITLKATSLAAMTNSYSRPITINYMNGTVDKTSIKLTITSPTPAATLAATAAKGSVAGTTAVTMVSSLGAGNLYVYEISTVAVTNKNAEDKMALTTAAFTSAANIPVTANQYITIYEINATTGNIVKYKSIQITADLIL